MPNKLSNETSPYLLQHKDNPVDWYPWGEEALAKARAEDTPIFLSIGYSACHWCHVMEHESFENVAIARLLNDHFVAIKVDREERPDLDQIYMNAVQMLTGRGGWPMSVFLTPDLKPFYGGTYWPPSSRRGMPGFDEVLLAVEDAWRNRREQALASAEQLTGHIRSYSPAARGERQLEEALLLEAGRGMERDFDLRHGGFGAAPKFPHAMNLRALLRLWQRTGRQQWLDMVTITLDAMHAGGMYDHLGGGFARYSVDDRWLVPHFEKMLYDNALLAVAYLEGYLATGDEKYATVVRETLDYILRDMTDPTGCFYSTEDADSEGVEGKFYVWASEEVRAVLGEEDAELFCRVYDVTPQGNFEGRSILNLPKTIAQQATLLGVEEDELHERLTDLRAKLLKTRSQRVRPGRDEKVLTNWNGLMVDAMARAGSALGEPRYLEAARRAADFLLAEQQPEPGRMLHTWSGGRGKQPAFLDDYTALATGLVSLYEATFEERYLAEAAAFLDTVLDRFFDAECGAFYYTSDDHEELIARTVELADNATPSGASLAATALLRLGLLTGKGRYLDAAHATLEASASLMERVPIATGQMLIALDMQLGPSHELLFVGDGRARCLAESVQRRFLPRCVAAYRDDPADGTPLLDEVYEGKAVSGQEPTLFACQSGACGEPVRGEGALAAMLDSLAELADNG